MPLAFLFLAAAPAAKETVIYDGSKYSANWLKDFHDCPTPVGDRMTAKDEIGIRSMNFLAYLPLRGQEILFEDPNFLARLRREKLEIKIVRKGASTYEVYDGWGNRLLIDNRIKADGALLVISPGRNGKFHFRDELKMPFNEYMKKVNDCFVGHTMKGDLLNSGSKYLNTLVDDDRLYLVTPAGTGDRDNKIDGYENFSRYVC